MDRDFGDPGFPGFRDFRKISTLPDVNVGDGRRPRIYPGHLEARRVPRKVFEEKSRGPHLHRHQIALPKCQFYIFLVDIQTHTRRTAWRESLWVPERSVGKLRLEA